MKQVYVLVENQPIPSAEPYKECGRAPRALDHAVRVSEWSYLRHGHYTISTQQLQDRSTD